MSSSFDAFEVRMQLLGLLKRLNASQQSIQKVVAFAIKYGSRCGEDLWDCMTEECEKGTLNVRINVLYLLDSLCETSLYVGMPDAPYLGFVTRDLAKVIDSVVPATREGILNLMSAKQILDSWRTKRLINPEVIDEVNRTLDERKASLHSQPHAEGKKRAFENFSHSDTLRRMEEDRERHKRLRERIWVLPLPHTATAVASSSRIKLPSGSSSANPSPESPFTPASPSHAAGGLRAVAAEPVGVTAETDPAELEFEQVWEGTGEMNEDDLRDMLEENDLCFAPRLSPRPAAQPLKESLLPPSLPVEDVQPPPQFAESQPPSTTYGHWDDPPSFQQPRHTSATLAFAPPPSHFVPPTSFPSYAAPPPSTRQETLVDADYPSPTPPRGPRFSQPDQQQQQQQQQHAQMAGGFMPPPPPPGPRYYAPGPPPSSSWNNTIGPSPPPHHQLRDQYPAPGGRFAGGGAFGHNNNNNNNNNGSPIPSPRMQPLKLQQQHQHSGGTPPPSGPAGYRRDTAGSAAPSPVQYDPSGVGGDGALRPPNESRGGAGGFVYGVGGAHRGGGGGGDLTTQQGGGGPSSFHPPTSPRRGRTSSNGAY